MYLCEAQLNYEEGQELPADDLKYSTRHWCQHTSSAEYVTQTFIIRLVACKIHRFGRTLSSNETTYW
jgi:hypothetical protein